MGQKLKIAGWIALGAMAGAGKKRARRLRHAPLVPSPAMLHKPVMATTTGDVEKDGAPAPIVHGDIKPSNLVFEEQSGHLSLIDWGSSVFAQLDHEGHYLSNNVMQLMSADLQTSNARLGDVYFIGPEQRSGALSSPRFDEQGVASEHMVAPQKAHAASRMPWGVQRGELFAAKAQGPGAASHWHALTRHLDDGAVPIDNNQVENQIRPWALGRSNWLFAGSLRSGKRAAAIMSLIQSARMNGHDPYAYLKDVLTRLPTQRASEIGQLLPHQWVPA